MKDPSSTTDKSQKELMTLIKDAQSALEEKKANESKSSRTSLLDEMNRILALEAGDGPKPGETVYMAKKFARTPAGKHTYSVDSVSEKEVVLKNNKSGQIVKVAPNRLAKEDGKWVYGL